MKISDLKVIMPVIKACIFESKIVEEYGEIHFLSDLVCVFNDECIVQYPCQTKINEEFSINFSSFEKVFSKLRDDATFEVVNGKLLIKSGNTRIKLKLKQCGLISLKKRLEKIPSPKTKLGNPYHFDFFNSLGLCVTALVPFGSLSQPFNSYLYYSDGQMIGCSSFRAVKKSFKVINGKSLSSFIISGDSATVLTKTWDALNEEDISGGRPVLFEINKDFLVFRFFGIITVTISNGYGIVEYPMEKINRIFSMKGTIINYPDKKELLNIIDMVSLFPKEFEDTTERISQSFDNKGIKIFSRNSGGSIKHRCYLKQKVFNGCFSFQAKDFKVALEKICSNEKEKINIELCGEKHSAFIFNGNKCRYVIAATKEIV